MGRKAAYYLLQQDMQFLIPLVTSYVCKIGFSELCHAKKKYRYRLGVEEDLGATLSDFIRCSIVECDFIISKSHDVNGPHYLRESLPVYINIKPT